MHNKPHTDEAKRKIGESSRGRKHSEEAKDKISESLKGRPVSKSTRKKIADKARGRKHSKATKQKLSALYPNGFVNRLTEEQSRRRIHSISEQRKGTHGYGRSKRDAENHAKAKNWSLMSPDGKTYTFNNLQSWCRKHEHLFFPDKNPASKLPLWRRAVSGFNDQIRKTRPSKSWYGWQLMDTRANRTT